MVTTALVLVILVALGFDFFNGFHDAANSIATVVSTRVLTPRQAVIWAAFFNFIAFALFGTKVAATIAKGVVDPSVFTLSVVFAGLVGAIAWDVLTWYLGWQLRRNPGWAGSTWRRGVFALLYPALLLAWFWSVVIDVTDSTRAATIVAL